jgi:hypothetical protein
MKTLTASLLATALIALAGPALSSPKVDEVVVTAKLPAAEMLSDMTVEIIAETSAELHASQPVITLPVVQVERPAPPAAAK